LEYVSGCQGITATNQPAGLADGSRWSFRSEGEGPPESASPELMHPGRGARTTRVRRLSMVRVARLWHPCRGAGPLLRRCPEVAAPKNPRRPPATVWQPSGLQSPPANLMASSWSSCSCSIPPILRFTIRSATTRTSNGHSSYLDSLIDEPRRSAPGFDCINLICQPERLAFNSRRAGASCRALRARGCGSARHTRCRQSADWAAQ
jgi:hypothetical protein